MAAALERAMAVAEPELRAADLQAAADALARLVGVIGVEDVLDQVFSSFCIGK
jgi:tRNA modification GTPase